MPAGSVAGEMIIAGQIRKPLYILAPVHPIESVARTAKLKTPSSVGVPENTPDGPSVMPAGIDPEITANVYGPVPPDAVNVCEYIVPNSPFGMELGPSVMFGQMSSV